MKEDELLQILEELNHLADEIQILTQKVRKLYNIGEYRHVGRNLETTERR